MSYDARRENLSDQCKTLAELNGWKIKTSYWAKPIPDRSRDWSAWDDATFSGEVSDPVGWGATEPEAIADLIEQLSERAQ